MEEIVHLRKENDGGGPHSITGPIYVEGAEPGDTLEVRILKIVPKADAFNFNIPGKEFPTVGQLASEFPEGFVRYYRLDLSKMQTEFKPGIVIDLKPFPGTFAVGVDPNEPDAKAGPADPRRQRPHQYAQAVEERIQHGRERAASRFYVVSAGVSERRADLDRRFPLPAGERRGESHRARMLL